MAPYLLTVLAILLIIIFSIPSEVTQMKYFNLTWYTVSFIAAYPLYRASPYTSSRNNKSEKTGAQ